MGQENNKPMNEVIHDQYQARYESAGVPIPDIDKTLEAVRTRLYYVNGENCELDIDGVMVIFPKTWQNEWAIIEKIYNTVLDSKSKKS